MENKVDTVICLQMGKTSQAKTLSGDFKVTTPENPLLSQQAVTSKGILVPYTNLQLNPYPNTQLDLFYSDNLSFSMHDSQYVTNQSMHESKYMTKYQLEKDIGYKVLQFINTMKITKLLVTKPYGVQTQQFLKEKDDLRQIVSGHNMILKNICIKLHSLASTMTALKIILIYV